MSLIFLSTDSPNHPPERCDQKLRRQLYQLCSYFSHFDDQLPHAHWQAEASRAGAAWIEIEHTVLLFYLRMMAVAIDEHAESGGFRLQVELAAIMHHIDGDAAKFKDFSFRQCARPRSSVDLTADRDYGGNLRERFEDFGGADIAGVEDAVGSAQSFDGFGPQQAVDVGDYA